MFRGLRICVVLVASMVTPMPVLAGVDVSFWELRSSATWRPESLPISDSETITDIINPLFATTTAQVNENLVETNYDFSWSRSASQGEFIATFSHAVRDPQVRSISSGRIRFLPTQDVRITVNGSVNYSHTPGELTSVDFGGGVYFADPFGLIANDSDRGGNFYLEPSSGTLNVSLDTTLVANTLYQYQFGLDTNNGSDPLPTGIADVNGSIRFTIEPVPEPATIALLIFPAMTVMARRRRRVS